MKPMSYLWTVVSIFFSISLMGQTYPPEPIMAHPCDTALVGVTVNLSLSQNCRLDIDSSVAHLLLGNYSPNLEYKVQLVDDDMNPIDRILSADDIGSEFMVALTGSGCIFSQDGGMGADTTYPAGFPTWSTFTLEDKTAPSIECRDTVTMSCIDFFFYQDDGGIVEDCDLDTVLTTFMDFNPNVCDIPGDSIAAQVIRSFVARDHSDNDSSCTEVINITRLEREDISFPDDLTLTCDTLSEVTDAYGNLIPPSLLLATGSGTLMDQYVFGVPTGSGVSIFGNNFKACGVRAYYEDLPVTEYKCKKVFQRFWTVYEWYCDEEVEYTHLQTIQFEDKTPPTMTFAQDTFYFDADPLYCEVTVFGGEIFPVLMTDNCSDVIDALGHDPYSGYFDVGDTLTFSSPDTIVIPFEAYDKCGNTAYDTITIITRDNSPPTAICMATMQVNLTDPDFNYVDATEFNVSSYDACGDITIQAQKMGEIGWSDQLNFSCADSTEVMVTLMVTDEAGLTDMCMIAVTVNKDSVLAECTYRDTVTTSPLVSGFVSFEDGMAVANAMVRISGDQNRNTTTDDEGYYEVKDPTAGEMLYIMPEKNNDPEMGITTLDAILLQRHLLGLADLDSPYKVIAGDLDANGRINAGDILEMRRMILGDISTFSQTESFTFIPSDLEFEDYFDPWANGEIFGKTLMTETESQHVDFMAIKMGDVNNSIFKSETRSRQSIALQYEAIEMGRYVEINITAPADMELDGFQTRLSYDAEGLRFMKMGNGSIPLSDEHYSLSQLTDGFISFSWNDLLPLSLKRGDVMIRMVFEKMIDSPIKLDISEDQMRSELYSDHEILRLQVEPKARELAEDFEVYTNVPNPWQESTAIEFSIPRSAKVSLQIYDASMRQVYTDDGHFEAGVNQFNIEYHHLGESGVYIYEIIYEDKVRVSKMTKL